MGFDLTKALKDMARNGVLLAIGGEDGIPAGRFGGAPDVPPDFQWPCYETAVYGDDTVRPRPLSFLAQFDCAALAPWTRKVFCLKPGCCPSSMR